MPFLSSRRNKARLAPELDDGELGKVLKSLRRTVGSGPVAPTDARVSELARFMEAHPADWDRRAHRLSVLADQLSGSRLPAAWASRDPRDATALVLDAWSALVRGRAEGAMEDASSTAKQCVLAAELAPEDPAPWVVLLGVARVERYRQSDVFGLWNEILARDRWHREAYLGMLGYLSPEEAGSRVQVLDFVDSVRARMPANAPCAAVELTAQVRQYHALMTRGGVEPMVARNHWTGAPATEALDRVWHTWPQQAFFHHAGALADLNLLAYALTAADRRQQAVPAFEALGNTVTAWPWNHDGPALTEFESARGRPAI
ncbi:hypothetical protein ACFY93_15875 [Streptomyces sp. NPDC008313]|uniref:hypothetical protein n=1 Tax=Streptomyces sp. NPDC008313 TaxID=3364826 RepID=UPI0036ED3812